jgi:hypothetical protein
MAVIKGINAHINETFVADVYTKAVFSRKKYNEPLVIPMPMKMNSSRHDLFLCERGYNIHKNKYAMTKRMIIISSGDSPSRSNIFVETIVTPQTITVNNAAM